MAVEVEKVKPLLWCLMGLTALFIRREDEQDTWSFLYAIMFQSETPAFENYRLRHIWDRSH